MMDASFKDNNHEQEKRNLDPANYHASDVSSDWQMNGNNNFPNIIQMGNCMVESSAGPTTFMPDSFCPPIWDHPINRHSLGYCDGSMQIQASIPSGIGPVPPVTDWTQSTMLKGSTFSPAVPGMVPPSLPHFPTDSAFMKDHSETKLKGDDNPTSTSNPDGESGKHGSQGSDLPKEEYIHVRERRGQATNSHSLAERVRREKISERMKFLQDLVPGCSKVTGKAVMLDEIINYVQSLQRQVEFLSMKLATVNPRLDFNVEALLAKDILQPRAGLSPSPAFPRDMTMPFLPQHFSQTGPIQVPSVWDAELHNIIRMGFNTSAHPNSQDCRESPMTTNSMDEDTVAEISPIGLKGDAVSLTINDERIPLLCKKGGISAANRQEFNGASFTGAVFNLSTTIIGAGIMALPAAMKVLGLGLGVVIIVFVAVLTEFSVDMLLRFSRASGADSYGRVMEDAFGIWGRRVLQLCVLINNTGMLIVYMIIIGDVLSGTSSSGVHHAGVLEGWFGEHWWTGCLFVLAVVTVGVFTPLACFKHIDSLRHTSAISVLLAFVFLLITIGIFAVKYYRDPLQCQDFSLISLISIQFGDSSLLSLF